MRSGGTLDKVAVFCEKFPERDSTVSTVSNVLQGGFLGGKSPYPLYRYTEELKIHTENESMHLRGGQRKCPGVGEIAQWQRSLSPSLMI